MIERGAETHEREVIDQGSLESSHYMVILQQ